MTKADRTDLWTANVALERECGKRQGSTEPGPMEAAFPTAASIVSSLEDEKDRSLSVLGWRRTRILIHWKTYNFYSRDALDVAVHALESATVVRVKGERRRRSPDGLFTRTETMNSDLLLAAQQEVNQKHRHRGRIFLVAVQLYSDKAFVSV